MLQNIQKKGSEFAQKSLGKLGSFLDKVNVKSDVIKIFINPDNTAKCSRGVVHTSLKEMLSGTKLGQKFVKSSMPTKAAAAAGLGVLLLGLPLAMLSSASKAGYIEAKHEKKIKPNKIQKAPLIKIRGLFSLIKLK